MEMVENARTMVMCEHANASHQFSFLSFRAFFRVRVRECSEGNVRLCMRMQAAKFRAATLNAVSSYPDIVPDLQSPLWISSRSQRIYIWAKMLNIKQQNKKVFNKNHNYIPH